MIVRHIVESLTKSTPKNPIFQPTCTQTFNYVFYTNWNVTIDFHMEIQFMAFEVHVEVSDMLVWLQSICTTAMCFV